jgi:hypothetical protein
MIEVKFSGDLFKGVSFLNKYWRGYMMRQLDKSSKRKKIEKGIQ